MGYIKHHAIIVTSSIRDELKKVHAKAKDIFGNMVSGIVKSDVNGYESFFICPDGSKEGWADSDTGDNRRKEFKEFVKGLAYEDGSNSIDFAELYYGEDNGKAEIIEHN